MLFYQQTNPTYTIKALTKAAIPNTSFDKESMRSVFRNLLENAIKYTQDKKEIILEADTDGKNVIFSIIDNGQGIPDNEKLNVFNKFYRIGSEEVRKTQGTGLGLFIVYEIIKAHDGSVQIEDNIPVGTRINIKIPIKT